MGEKRGRVGGQEEVDLPCPLDDAVELVKPEDRTQRGLADACEDGRAGKRTVAGYQPVPLDAAGKPGVEGSQICRLEHRIAKDKVAARREVLELDQPPAERWRDHGPQAVVLDD